MKTLSARSTRESPRRAWVRHATAMTGAVVVNGALVLFLVSWRAGNGRARAAPVSTVPLRVVRDELEQDEPVEVEPTERIVLAEPIPQPPLPAIPAPKLPEAVARLDAPTPLEVPLSPPRSTRVPLYVSSSAQPAVGPVSPAPAPRPAARAPRATGRRIAASRGPVMIRPPNLSDYYPRRARMRGVTGTTTLRVTIGADGRVEDVEVLASTPEGVFETAARRVGRSLTFQPALRDNRPVRAMVRLNLVWRLE